MATKRTDLAAALTVLRRRLMAAERPIITGRGLTMWGYVVMSALRDGHASSQQVLAEVTGQDRTRIIGVLDELEENGLIERQIDPRDRRVRVIALTPVGREVQAATQRDIRAMEDEVLSHLSAEARQQLQTLLARAVARPQPT
jgi:MarR family transcriptional regulator, organic hydroperoxide resistance regulator